MELLIRKSFYRDWDNINNKELGIAIENITGIVRKANNITQIPRIKKLIKFEVRYKIEIQVQTKIYWIFCLVRGNKMEFVRVKSETYFKKNF